jgi:type IV pilus assembly protein PilP
MKYAKLRITISLFLVLSLFGCGDGGINEVREWMDTVKKEARANVPKLSEPKVYEAVPYSGKGLTDPFNPAKLLLVLARLKAESGNNLRPDLDRHKEVLEQFPLDSLKMVGFIEDKKLRNALIQVDKTVYQARVGNYLGQNFGMITKITEAEVDIKEIVQDAAGEWVERTATLELQEAKQ